MNRKPGTAPDQEFSDGQSELIDWKELTDWPEMDTLADLGPTVAFRDGGPIQ